MKELTFVPVYVSSFAGSIIFLICNCQGVMLGYPDHKGSPPNCSLSDHEYVEGVE